jgi:hypothetical protein
MGAFLNLKALLSLNASGFQLGMKKAESTAKAFAHEMKAEFARAFGTAALLEFSRRIIETADKIADVSQELGISSDSLQEWQYAAKKTGASADDVEKFFATLADSKQKALAGNDQAIESFQRLGLSLMQLSHMRVDDIGKKIGEAFKAGDPQELLGFLKDLGGKTARKLIPAMREGLDELFKNAREAGAVWSETTIAELKEAREEVMKLSDTFAGPLARAIGYAAKMMDSLFNGIKPHIAGLAAYLGGFTAGIDPSKDMTKFDWRKAHATGLEAMGEAKSEIAKEIEAQEKAFNAKTEALKGNFTGTGAASRPPADRIIDFGKIIGGFSKPEGLNEWQRAGGGTLQESTTPILKQQLNAQEKMVERLDALRDLYAKGGMGAADNGGGFF